MFSSMLSFQAILWDNQACAEDLSTTCMAPATHKAQRTLLHVLHYRVVTDIHCPGYLNQRFACEWPICHQVVRSSADCIKGK